MKPENNFIARVHKHLPATIYREKMHNAYRGGTPDVWYSGTERDLWVEYKYIQSIPKRSATQVPVGLSALQRQWIGRRLTEGRYVIVIIGCKQGGYVLPALDFQPNVEAFFQGCVSVKELAHHINHFITRKELDEINPIYRAIRGGTVPAPISIHLPVSTA